MNRQERTTDKFFAPVEKLLGAFLAFLMAVMVAVVTWQVITRFLMTQPSSFTEELSRFLLIWIGILGAAYAFRTGAHLGLDLLTQKLRGTAKRNTALVANLICFLFAASVMVYGGLQLVALTLDLNQTSSALRMPVGYVYTVIPLSGILICLFSLDNMVHPGEHATASADEELDHLDV